MEKDGVHGMISEIKEIPEYAEKVLTTEELFSLPPHVPYIGIGSSYYAPLAMQLAGYPVNAYPASEFYHVNQGKSFPHGVLISQSGKSSEVLWCSKLFREYIAVTNEGESPLAMNANCSEKLLMHAGREEFSSSKTYVNTLLVLLRGFQSDIHPLVAFLRDYMAEAERTGREMAAFVHEKQTKGVLRGIFILGAGCSTATALQASLICSESTRMVFTGMPLAWYDHGYKETAEGSVVLFIAPESETDARRAEKIAGLVGKSGGYPYFTKPLPGGLFKPVLEIIPFNFLAVYLAEYLGRKDFFTIGSKVTENDL
jgi:glucosamine--fructose-6-phosphate aminotransferase (isomerizing)